MPDQPGDYADSRRVSRLRPGRVDPLAALAAEIGPAFVEYRRQWEEARAFRRQPEFPLQVDYEIMFRCNLRCPMCLMSLPASERSRFGEADKRLSPATMRDLIDQGAEAGQKAMGFGGLWEPLLAPELPELVAYGRSRGLVDVMFNTNGLLLTEKIGRDLIAAGLTRLMISLDADTAETYGRMRTGSDFETVTANIADFMALKKKLGRALPLVRLSFCLTAVNEGELAAFQDRWRGTADFLSIQAYGRYQSLNPPGFPGASAGGPPAGRCAQPHKRLLVRHNGQVLPCCDASGTALVMGNIYEQSLADIWRGAEMAELRAALARNDLRGPAAPCLACQAKFSPI